MFKLRKILLLNVMMLSAYAQSNNAIVVATNHAELSTTVMVPKNASPDGGVKGIVSNDDVTAGKVKILAPEGFLEHAVSENVYAGNAMSRRSMYMYGPFLPKQATGQVDAALGKTTSVGTITLIVPTDSITKTGEKKSLMVLKLFSKWHPIPKHPLRC